MLRISLADRRTTTLGGIGLPTILESRKHVVGDAHDYRYNVGGGPKGHERLPSTWICLFDGKRLR